MKTGLYIVSTPIGNLKDITLRALETLKEVDFIICEDTRVTAILLNHYEIKKEMISFNAQSESKKIDYVISRIKTGQPCALVSDAGTPSISDPGNRLVTECIRQEIYIESVPGVTALITALTVSGLPTDSFIYEGFIPQKKGRQTKLKEFAATDKTIIFYESVYRIEKLLDELIEYMPERKIVICRELTKMFQEVIRGSVKELHERKQSIMLKGEFVVIIAPISWK